MVVLGSTISSIAYRRRIDGTPKHRSRTPGIVDQAASNVCSPFIGCLVDNLFVRTMNAAYATIDATSIPIVIAME